MTKDGSVAILAGTAALACWPASERLAPDYVQFWSASRILAALDESFDLVGCHLGVAASIGIAFAGHACRDPDQLLHAADVAMSR